MPRGGTGLRRLPLALGSQPPHLWHRRVQPRLREHARGSARPLRPDLRGLVRRRQRRRAERTTADYDWPVFLATVRKLQPKAVIFSDAGPDVRWVGNERGEAPLTVWSTFDRHRYEPGTPLSDELGEGTRFGEDWVPAECDVSIRPGWFYRQSEDTQVKSPARCSRFYEKSVGRNCTLLLNVPPDRRGLVASPDLAALAGFRTALTPPTEPTSPPVPR